jgi:histidine triad (HIT) family protein
MADCLFCRIVAGEIPATVVRETDRTVAFRDIAPQAPAHLLIIPREHHGNAADLAAADPALLAALVTEAAAVAAAEGIAESGYRLVFNTGAEAGQTVFHVHLHLLGGAQLAHFGAPAEPGGE